MLTCANSSALLYSKWSDLFFETTCLLTIAFNTNAQPYRFDHQSRHVFIGDVNGQIEMVKLENNSIRAITNLKGHSATIRCLEWNSVNQLLFSGASDKSIICWDIGGKKGTAYELQGHK